MAMKRLSITDADALKRIWSVFAWLDGIRWQEAGNYNLINYAYPSEGLTPAERVLTHWLCYITDRQMSFEYIWDVGGYVLSKITREYCQSAGLAADPITSRVAPKGDGEKYCLQLDEGHGSPVLRDRSIPMSGPIQFASRFLATDLACVVRTLTVLDMLADRNITRFVSLAVSGELERPELLRWIGAALFGLTYQDSRQMSNDILADPERAVASAAVRGKRWAEAFDADREKTIRSSLRQLKTKAFGQAKRLWCSVRDYAKSPVFRLDFAAGLADAGDASLSQWWLDDVAGPKSMCHQLELPGDVWNNAPAFRNGLVGSHISSVPTSWTTARLVRELHLQLFPDGNPGLYPEQFDVTFDFVPRMCSRKMCDVCFFGDSGIEDLCTATRGKLCAPALVACGYRMTCPGNCEVAKNAARGLCNTVL